eukprot:CAMPEP_0171535906 /NCGR_PEP_ID=MMETSP0959-20130129/17413_1 /TAXON_ID=87120 /ORGANISM="Aurantiochytrium limacinum, Strain ATCCMYA-1381" /LENGTH=169 /DNA_ID=CAMNT_0012081901 /DNA_START=135 /DNA_END=640 /DNA_ORIENTATION=+
MTLGLSARAEAESKDGCKMPTPPLKVAIIAEKPKLFEKDVQMWVYEEEINGRKLTEIMNEDHENVKYLPNIKLPKNIIAEPDLAKACDKADVLVFVVPHQFLDKLLPTIKKSMSENAIAISLIKGIDFDDNDDLIRKGLDVEVSALMGANVASEIAEGDFAEATIGGPA